MSWISLVNAAKAASAAAKASKGLQTAAKISKGLWTLVEIADAGMDMYMLGNEINKALGNTDPDIKALVDQVTAKGVEYDTLMKVVTDANVSITNLQGAITSLYGVSADFEERQGLAFTQITALDSLKSQLNKSTPTTYSWFENTAIPDGNLSSETREKTESIQKLLGPDYLTIGIASAGLGMRSVALGFSSYKKQKSGQDGPEVPELRRRNAMIFDGADLEAIKDLRAKKRTRFQKARSGVAKYGKIMLTGVDKLVTAGGFGLNIYMLIQQKKAKEEMKRSLSEMLARFNSEISTYQHVLDGCKKENGEVDQAALHSVAEIFGVDLVQQGDDARETLAKGYRAVLTDYDGILDGVVDSLDAAYSSMIERFETAQVDAEDSQIIASLKGAYAEFDHLKAKGKDDNESLASSERKTVLEDIRDGFSQSVAKQMRLINQELTKAIADHKSLSILNPYAEGIIADAEDFGLSFPLTDRFLSRKASEVKSSLDIAFPSRERFKEMNEILQALKKLIPELRAESSDIRPASKAPTPELPTKPTDAPPIHITDQYVWLPEEHSLPLSVSCNVLFNANSEFIPCFSKTKAQWASENCDALSWYFSPDRHDFTFRTKLFRSFPAVERLNPGFNPKVGKKYKMRCEIKDTTATYWIDDLGYATASYAAGTVPSKGCIGFAVYGREDVVVDSLTVHSI